MLIIQKTYHRRLDNNTAKILTYKRKITLVREMKTWVYKCDTSIYKLCTFAALVGGYKDKHYKPFSLLFLLCNFGSQI